MSTWIAIDPALGGGNAVIVAQPTRKKLYVVDCRIDYGLSRTEEQLEIIEGLARRYRPSRLIVEYDAQQKGLGNDERLRNMSAKLGFEIVAHLTRGQKLAREDVVFHVAAMNQSFIRQEISIPWADDDTQTRMYPLVKQLEAWRPDIPTKKLRQDAVMALWFLWRAWMKTRVDDKPNVKRGKRPSWMRKQPQMQKVG